MSKLFIILGAAFMMLGVGAGAFGAHGLSSYFEKFPDMAATYDTAVRYHVYHALGLFAAAWLADKYPVSLTTWGGYLLVAGIVIFSGSLYLLVFTRQSWLGAITPIGGVAFIAGWACLLLAAWRA
ncbi:MAG: DUF423 domain-containing protein [Ardenticatenaceae bacterium]|nr:DUF423 domain-containing protein [Ardenticatenaceae bacterium]